MADLFGSEVAQPVSIAPVGTGRRSTVSASRRATLIFATLAAMLVCGIHAGVAGANTIPASGVGYLSLTLVFFACSFAFWTRARAAEGALFIRWSVISAAALTAAIGYFPSFMQAVLNTPPARQMQTACFNASEALYLLAILLFFAGVARSIVVIDMMQALLFVVLRFHLIYSPATHDHFTPNHLLVGQLMALCLFLSAVVGCLGATSHAELKFLRTLSWFFGLRLIAFFLSNQVSYTWLHYENCSLWDVPGVVLLAGFALYLLYTSPNSDTVASATLRPSLAVRSMMPSFLALVTLMLGLFLLRTSLPLAAGAISMSLVCYVVRTALLQAETARDKARLESRNEHLEGLAVRDPLTGIGNRRSLAQAYGMLQAAPEGEHLTLLLMDIDHFKQANDCHGHLHGDNVLLTLAKKLEWLATAVKGSHCARFGGDEFALLLVGMSPEDAAAVAEELRVRFSARALAADGRSVTLSIGVASLTTAREMPLERLIGCADRALYRAKLMGRDRVEIEPAWERGGSYREMVLASL
jgi:diguanylate cyclase (GGDEF)-like protein